MNPLEVLAHLAEVGTPPDAGTALRISVGLDETIERLKQETFPFLAAGGAELQFVFGPYGRGKSHFLRSVEETAQQQGLVTAYVDCRTGQSPFRSLKETYSMIASAFTAPWTNTSLRTGIGVAGIIENMVSDTEQSSARELLKKVQNDPHQVPDYRNLVYAYGMSVLKNQVGKEIHEALQALIIASDTYRVTVGQLYRDHPELPRPLGKLGRRNAGPWLRSLISLPHSLGYPGLVILFDETERTFQGSSRKGQREHLANLRNFVDYMAVGAFRGCAIYYAVVEEFIERAREHLDALSQRIERVRLGELENFCNRRAVWVDLNELTVPGPAEPAFFEHLAERIVDVGREAGLSAVQAKTLLKSLKAEGVEYAESIYEGAVREFVKMAASQVAEEIMH